MIILEKKVVDVKANDAAFIRVIGKVSIKHSSCDFRKQTRLYRCNRTFGKFLKIWASNRSETTIFNI